VTDPHPTPSPGDLDVVYLSPHLDDAVLSCAGRMAHERARGRRVGVWTLFTADEPAEPPSPFAATLRRWWNLPAGEVMATRRREDRAACERLGIRALHGGWTEAPYRLDASGRPPYDSLDRLFGEVDGADSELEAELAERFAALSGARVVAPLGVGGHVDHRIVRRAALRAGIAAAFYEEFPYVEWKWGALRRALGRKADWQAEVLPLDEHEVAERVAAITLYRSQVPALFRSEARLAKQVRRAVRRAGGERLWRPRSPRANGAR